MRNSVGTADEEPIVEGADRGEPAAFPGADWGAEPASRQPEPLLTRAQTLCELGRYTDAVSAAASAISKEPRAVEAWCVMADAQLGSEKPAAALEAARTAAKLNPGQERPHRVASLALERLGREEDAAEAALRATRCAPGSWQAHVRLAHSLAALRGRLGEAREAAERARALRPEQPEPHLALGAVALAAGERADAASAFCAALAADPQCVEAHNRLASVQALGARGARDSLMSRLAARFTRPSAQRVEA
ncbi:MAG: tetratricopeptide repeat protein [Solirubrobacteraceae bacterium]